MIIKLKDGSVKEYTDADQGRADRHDFDSAVGDRAADCRPGAGAVDVPSS